MEDKPEDKLRYEEKKAKLGSKLEDRLRGRLKGKIEDKIDGRWEISSGINWWGVRK